MASSKSAEAVTAAYQRSLVTLSKRLTALLGAAWLQLPEASQQTANEWLATVVPVVLGAQMHAVSLSDAYLAAFVTAELDREVEPVGLDPSRLVGIAARSGTPLEQVYSRPLGFVAKAVAGGVVLADALRAEQWRIDRAAATDVQLTARAARVEWGRESDDVQGWRRVTGGSGCALCASASGRTYRTDELMPLHPGCSCTTEPVLEGAGRQRPEPEPTIDDSPELAQAARDGEPVARVVNDPELGPLLEAR